MMRLAATVLAFNGLFAVVAAALEPASQLRLFHRVHHPLAAQAPWLVRGTVTIGANNEATFEASPTFKKDLTSFSESFSTVENTDLLLYQVALERPGDNAEAQYDYTSVKACHLYLVTSETVYLHAQDAVKLTPHSIDYFVSPTPHDGSCPKSKVSKAQLDAPFQTFAENLKSNTTVVLKAPVLPPLPTLKTPPPLTTDGRPLEPMPEKTFLEKYWLYVVGAFMAIALLAGPEDPPKKQE